MVEGEATQEPAPGGAPASPSEENPVETQQAASPAETEATPSEVTASEDSAEAAALEAPPVVRLDWSHLRGFQTVEPAGEADAAREDYAEELVKELSARAARFANAVDESIVLSSDGVMRWLGDPIARVVAGETLLTPRPVLLADEALAGEERGKVETRASLWLAAHVRKLLGPLASLAEGSELPEAARGLGAKIAEALGVLERERVRVEARALDQNARGAMRKLGVRFGSHYIYVPILLKPAARGLCSLLWTLRRGAEAGADRLLAFAAAGRTSFANEGLLSPDSYRVAGFRLCGERVVRVDIIERLSDLIRAALPDHMRAGSRPASDAYGFVVSPQMTSLTGCSGEAFASILRSLGFESVKVGRAAYEAASRRAPTEPIKPASAEGAEAPLEAAPATDGAQLSTAEAVEAHVSPEDAQTSAEDAQSEPAAEDGPAEEVRTGDDGTAAEEVASEPQAALAVTGETDEAALASSDEAAASAEPTSADAAPTDDEARADASLDERAVSLAAETVGEASVATPAETEAPAAEAAASGADEEIEIWRPAPRRPRAPQRPQGAAHRDAPAPAGKPRDQRRRARFEPTETAAAPAADAAVAPPQNDRGQSRREEEQRRRDNRGKDDAKPRDDRRPQRDFGPRREARPVDPDSPFAKLAALKPLLERRDKRP